MTRVFSIATAAAVALTAAVTINVAAQDFNIHERTFLTFSNPVELPGMQLEAGTYVFRLADTPSRNIVQVLTEDEMEVLGQYLFIPAERQEPTGETVITFRETRAGATPAVQYWYYPGETIGKEFVYPKDQAMQIAQRTGATVMTEEGPIDAQGQVVQRDEPAQAEVAVAETEPAAAPAEAQAQAGVTLEQQPEQPQEPAVAARETQEQMPVGTTGVQQESQREPAAAQSQQSAQGQQRNQQPAQGQFAQAELPRTASPLALGGLIALLSLAGAAGVRAFRQ